MKTYYHHNFSIFLIIILTANFLYAQKHANIDSLKAVLFRQEGVEKVKTYDRIFNYYYLKNLDSAKVYVDKMLEESQRIGKPRYQAMAYDNLGIYYIQKKSYFPAEEALQKAINIEKQHRLIKILPSTYRILAGLYYYKGEHNKSIEYVYKALEIYDSIKDYEGVASCYNNIGNLHSDPHKAIDNYLKGLEIIDKYHIRHDKTNLYQNLANKYRQLNQYDSSYYYLQKAISIDRKNKSYGDLAYDYNQVALLLMKKNKDNDSVGFYFNKALEMAKKHKTDDIEHILINKAKWYYLLQKYDSAIVLLQQQLPRVKAKKEMNNIEKILYYLYMSKKNTGDYQGALKDLENLVDVQDSMEYNKTLIKINNLEEKYKNKKKELKIKHLEKVKKLDQKIKWLLGFIGLSILFVSLYIIRNLLVQKKRNEAEKKRIEADLRLKNKQLTSQALMMMQKNTLLNDILHSLSELKNIGTSTQKELVELKRKLKRSMRSENDWELFKQYFEMVNKDFFKKLKEINDKLTPSELKLCALIKLRFNIKESATLLNISPDSVKSVRYTLRKKLGLKRGDNLYDFLSNI